MPETMYLNIKCVRNIRKYKKYPKRFKIFQTENIFKSSKL